LHFLRLAGVLLADERDRRGPPNPRLRGRSRASTAIRSRLAVAGCDRRCIPRAGPSPPSGCGRGSARISEASMGDRGLAPVSAAGSLSGGAQRLSHAGRRFGPKCQNALVPPGPPLLTQLDAQATADRVAGLASGRDTDIDYERVEELLDQARKRFQERQFEAALTAAQEASRIAERPTEQLRRASWSYAVLAAQG